MISNRGDRRDKTRKKKEKYRKILEQTMSSTPTDREVGIAASTHGATCSCPMCCNPRHSVLEKDKLTKQEKIADITTKEQKEEQ